MSVGVEFPIVAIGVPVLVFGLSFYFIALRGLTRWPFRLLPGMTSKMARDLVQAIRLAPEEWHMPDEYRLGHESGEVEIWVANKDYALHVEIREPNRRGPRLGERVRLAPSDAVIIWTAFKHWRRTTKRAFVSPNVALASYIANRHAVNARAKAQQRRGLTAPY